MSQFYIDDPEASKRLKKEIAWLEEQISLRRIREQAAKEQTAEGGEAPATPKAKR